MRPTIFVLALVLASCGGGTTPSTCVGGMSAACACGSGETGAQVCGTDGRYGPCVCEALDLGIVGDLQSAADLGSAVDLAHMADMVCAPVAGAKRVFVTKDSFTGGLAFTAGAGGDGLAGGDKLCQNAADAASLGGTWRAWLSTTSTSAISRIGDVGPWYLVDRCTKVFTSKASITTSGPLVAIDRDPLGAVVTGIRWTGTKADGTGDFDCQAWTDPSSDNGDLALVGNESQWTNSGTAYCGMTAHLDCFEQ